MDQAAVPRDGGDGNRRRRDRHRRGERGDRPEGARPLGTDARDDEAGTRVVPEAHGPMADAEPAGQPDRAPPMIPTPPVQAIEPSRLIAPVEFERDVAPVAAAAPVAPEPIERFAAPVAVPEPVAPERMVQSRPAPPRPIEALPSVSMTLPADSGLELVETRSIAIPMAEPDPTPPAGPRRVRPPRVVIAEEPLQIVETHKGGQPPAI